MQHARLNSWHRLPDRCITPLDRPASRLLLLAALLLLALMLSPRAFAAAGTISTDVSPLVVGVGDTITVTMRISNYTDQVEIDSFNFDVNYPSASFTFIAGSFNLGAATGVDQQWLSKPNQETVSQGYVLSSSNGGGTPGVVNIAMGDFTPSTPERGTIANSGFLVSFKLQATRSGASSIAPAARANAFVLADTVQRQAGIPLFASARVTVTNPPAIVITSPTNGQTFQAPATFPITTTVFDPNNSIAFMEFYANGALVGQDSTTPFSITASNVAQGSYALTAIGRTAAGGPFATSAPVSITVTAPALDFGDAPQQYPVLLSQNGARHIIKPGMFLGARVDAEQDGQPESHALGDDNIPAGNPSDEDGVTFLTPLNPGSIARVDVVASQTGRLDAWIDFGVDGSWAEAIDHIFASQALSPGTNHLAFVVPSASKTGITFARFRYSSQGDLSFIGQAADGEVEDYQVAIQDNRTDLTIQKLGSPNPATVGDNLTYMLLITNGGPGAATGVTVTDPLPSEVSFVSVSTTAGTCTLQTPASGSQVFCDLGNLAPGGFAKITILVTVDQAATISNTATVSGNEPDPNPNNNSDTVRIIAHQPQLPPCDRTNKGTDFWLTFPGNYAPDPTNQPRLSLCIAGTPGTTGTVGMPGLGFLVNYTLPASQRVLIGLPRQADLSNNIDLVEFKGIHVTANAEVAVYGLNHIPYTTEGFLGLPTDTIGKEYFVQGFGNTHTGVPELNGTEFAFVATADNTTVQIVPSVTTAGHPAGIPYNITLDQGRTYQLRNTNDAPNDLTGTYIVADKPVAVFGGHQCANVPTGNQWFCDYLVEQLFPTQRGGTNFLVMPFATRSGATYRFMGVQDNTTVRINGIAVAVINRGQTYTRALNIAAQLSSDKPTLLTQFSNSSDSDGVVNSDPAMTIVPDTKLYLPQYIVCTPDMNFLSHYISVIAPTPAAGTISLDGVAIAAAAYSPIAASGYSGATVSVAPGAHTLASSGLAAVPFGVMMYGYAEYDAYAFPGGMLLPDITPPTLTCLVSNLVVHIGQTPNSPCTASVPDLTRQVRVTDNCTLPDNVQVVQDIKPGTLVGAGVYPITLSAADANGNVGSCVITFTVIDDSQPFISCPEVIRTNCTSAAGTRVRFIVTAQTTCGTKLEVTCDPPSGSLFPPGTTTVTCSAQTDAGNKASCSFPVTVDCTVVSIKTDGQTVTVSWTGQGVLLEAKDVAGPYNALTGAKNPYVAPANQGQRFYQVQSGTSP